MLLAADRRPNYICKTDFHCSPCPLESRIGSTEMGFYPKVFMQVCRRQTWVGGDSIESSIGCSLPPAVPCKPQNTEPLTTEAAPPARGHTNLPLRRERRRLRRFFVRRKHFFLLGAWLRFLRTRGHSSRLCTEPHRMSEACD